MSRVFCFAFLVLFCVAVPFADCREGVDCTKQYTPGQENTNLWPLEFMVKSFMYPLNIVDDVVGKIFARRRPSENDGDISTQLSKTKSSFGNVLEKYADKIRAIFPGTLWCGAGNITSYREQVGLFRKTDACCRTHDECSKNIEAGESELNLKNNGIFTRSACECDYEFHDCLRNVGGAVATKIGITYFDMLRPQCFQCLCPDDCTDKDETTCKGNCTRYEWVSNSFYLTE